MQVSTITRHIKNYNFSEPTAVDHQPQYARSTCPLSPDTGVNYVVKHNTTGGTNVMCRDIVDKRTHGVGAKSRNIYCCAVVQWQKVSHVCAVNH